MWSETVGLIGQDEFETKKIGLGLVGLLLCCETRSCYARRHNDLEGHSNFSSTIYSFSILCLEHHYCGVHLQVKSDKCLCTSGGVLGLENLVLFTSLITAVGSMSNIIDVAVALDLLTSTILLLRYLLLRTRHRPG